MPSIKRLVLGSCLVSAVGFGGACRGQLPPTEPPRGVEDPTGTRTDDGLAAAPLTGSESPSVAALSGAGSGGGGGLPLPSDPAGRRSQ